MSREDPLVVKAREHYRMAATSDEYNRRVDNFRKSLRAYDGDQWDEADKNRRDQEKRPYLTVNKLVQPVQQVVNDYRQNRQAIKISPVDGGADRETAKVFQGLIRHIEYRSGATTAYDAAFEYAAAGGYGYWRVHTEYVNETDFEQELCIRKVHDPETVKMDPNSRECDGRDQEFCFVEEMLSREDYKRRYGDSDLAGMLDADHGFKEGDHPLLGDWIQEDLVRVTEYWYVEHRKRRLVLLNSLGVATLAALQPDQPPRARIYRDELPDDIELDDAMILMERDVDERTIYQCMTNGHEILSKTLWPGKWIPIIPCYGKEIYVEGKRHIRSMIWNSLDAQKLFNYYRTSEAENIALSPKAPWIGPKGTFKDPKWKTANTMNHPYLEYELQDSFGKPAPPPTRNQFEPPIQALSIGAAQADDDIKATTGRSGPSLGEEDANRSGRAILALQRQGDISNFHLTDNMTRSISHTGRILLDLIPYVYDGQRMVRIVGEDEVESVVQVAQNFNLAPDGDTLLQQYIGMPDEEREAYQKQRGFQIDVGQYDVTVTSGPSYQTKRQESAAQSLEFASLDPEGVPLWRDLLVRSLDLQLSDEIAERLIPDQFREEEGQENIPPQVRQESELLQQAVQELTAKLDEAEEKLRSKQIESQADIERQRMENESRERIQESRNRTEILKVLAQNETAESIALLKAQMEGISNLLDVEAAKVSANGNSE